MRWDDSKGCSCADMYRKHRHAQRMDLRYKWETGKAECYGAFWIKVYGSIEGEGATEAVIPLNMHEEVIGFIKEKFKKKIQSRKNSISKEYEKLNELLK